MNQSRRTSKRQCRLAVTVPSNPPLFTQESLVVNVSCGVSTTSVGTVLYRAVVNGSSDLLKATQILDYVEEWRESTESLLHNNFFRLRIYRKKKCTGLALLEMMNAKCTPCKFCNMDDLLY